MSRVAETIEDLRDLATGTILRSALGEAAEVRHGAVLIYGASFMSLTPATGDDLDDILSLLPAAILDEPSLAA